MNHALQTLFRSTLTALLGATLALGACSKSTTEAAGDEPGMAAGVGQRSQVVAVWKALAQYDSGYLKKWKDALADPDPTPRDVLDAFNEIGYAVTGPGGFWRNTVPKNWFGCENDPNTAVCQRLAKANSEDFKAWDAFQNEISDLPDGKEANFLAKNHKKMLDYLATYVPDSPNMSEMKRTAFFKSDLAQALEATAADDGGL